MLVVSEQMHRSALPIIPSENPDIASCLRARASLNATDNSLLEYAEKVIPMNPMPDGTCRTLKSQYAKNSIGNFIRGGGYGATGVMEIIYEQSESLPPLQI